MTTESRAVAILDRHMLVRESLSQVLAMRGVNCAPVTGEPAQFFEELAQRTVDVALIDPALDPASEQNIDGGLAVLDGLRLRFPLVRPVVLASAPAWSQFEELARRGAWGFLRKPASSPAAVLEAIEAVQRGERRFDIDLIASFHGSPGSASPAHPRLAGLTDRELEVLGLVALGLDNLKIAATISLAERTVKGHVSSLYRKLQADNRVELALRARELGVRAPIEARPLAPDDSAPRGPADL